MRAVYIYLVPCECVCLLSVDLCLGLLVLLCRCPCILPFVEGAKFRKIELYVLLFVMSTLFVGLSRLSVPFCHCHCPDSCFISFLSRARISCFSCARKSLYHSSVRTNRSGLKPFSVAFIFNFF